MRTDGRRSWQNPFIRQAMLCRNNNILCASIPLSIVTSIATVTHFFCHVFCNQQLLLMNANVRVFPLQINRVWTLSTLDAIRSQIKMKTNTFSVRPKLNFVIIWSGWGGAGTVSVCNQACNHTISTHSTRKVLFVCQKKTRNKFTCFFRKFGCFCYENRGCSRFGFWKKAHSLASLRFNFDVTMSPG